MNKTKDPRFGTMKKLTIASNIMMFNSQVDMTNAYLSDSEQKKQVLLDSSLVWISRATDLRKKRAKIKSELIKEGLMNLTKRDEKREVPDY